MLTLNVQESCLKVFTQGKRKIRFFPSVLSDSVIKEYSSYSQIPRSPSIPVLGTLPLFLKAGGQTYLHKYVDDLHKKLGPIFINKMVGQEMLFISDPDANIKVYSSEGPYPEHFLLDAWILYLNSSEQKRGLFFMDGKEWHENRKVLNRVLLTKNSMANHVQKISSVCKEFMNVWKVNPPNEHLEYQLYSWNIECMGEIAIGQRLGYLEKLKRGNDHMNKFKNQMEDKFVKSIYETFLESANLFSIPAKVAKGLKLGAWKRFCSAVSTSLQFGNMYVEKGINGCDSEENKEIKNSIVYKLLKNEKIDKPTTRRLLVDLFLASADTTSHTAAWILYLLGRNPGVAEKAREEIFSILEKPLTLETINSLKYVNGIIREAMRMYPIATFLTRKLARDTDLYGYSVPAGTMVISSLYTMGRNPEYFTDPESFCPERWFREKHIKCPSTNLGTPNLQTLNRRAYIPWGLGGRSCVGKRVAELDLSLLIIEALKNFEWTVEEDVEMIMRMVAVPASDIKLNLKSI